MPDPSPSTPTVLNSNFLKLGRSCGGRPQRPVHPHAVTCQHCDTHYFSRPRTRNLPIVGWLLVRRATSSATEPTNHSPNYAKMPYTRRPRGIIRMTPPFGDESRQWLCSSSENKMIVLTRFVARLHAILQSSAIAKILHPWLRPLWLRPLWEVVQKLFTKFIRVT